MSTDPDLDRWAAWILYRRDGDDPEQQEKALEYLIPIRDTERLERHVRPLADAGRGVMRSASAYLVAIKPA
jgi:hypothetical protein